MKPQKNNLRSFRFSDEVYAVLEKQTGKSLNDKFENLVIYCNYKVPKINAELEQCRKELSDINHRILEAKVKLNEMNELQSMKNNLSKTLTYLSLQALDFKDGLDKL